VTTKRQEKIGIGRLFQRLSGCQRKVWKRESREGSHGESSGWREPEGCTGEKRERRGRHFPREEVQR